MNSYKRKYLFTLVFLNISILIISCFFIFRGHQDDIVLYDIPLYDSQGVYDTGADGNVFSTAYPVSQYQFVGRTGSLRQGIYTMNLYYTTDQDCYSISYDSERDGLPYPAIYADSYALSSLSHLYSSRIWVNGSVDYLDICIKCGNEREIFQTDSSFSIEKIELERDYKTTILYRFFKLLSLLVLLDAVVCLFWNMNKIKENIYVVLGLLCIFMISSLSVMANFQAIGHDSIFHFSRIIGLADGLLNGDFPVKMSSAWLNGYGYAASVCYGDALLYFPAVLYAAGVPLIHAYKIYILLINAGTVLISYHCFNKISRHRYIGVTCTALYCLSISRILNIYLRAAVGEYSAFMFFPLILLSIWEIYDLDSQEHSEKGWLLLCLGMTGIIQTHILSVEMVCIFLALTVLILIRKMSVKVFFSFLKSILAALGLNLGFLLPFLDYSTDSLRVFSKRTIYGIQNLGLSIYELFSFGTTATGHASDALQGPSGRIPESLGFSMLVVLLLTCIVLSECQDWKGREKPILLISLGLSAVALWMTTYYFPWNFLASVPLIRNIIASIQFPWRFMSIAIPLLTCTAGLTFVKIKDMFGQRLLYHILIGICLFSAFQGLSCMDMINRNAAGYSIYYDGHPLMNMSQIVSIGEYLLADTDESLIWTDLSLSGENTRAEIISRKGTLTEVSCYADENAWIELPIFAYKYYQCIDSETLESYPVTRGTNNKIHIDLPDNYQGILKIYFREPWYWRLAEIISLITAISLLVCILRKRKY